MREGERRAAVHRQIFNLLRTDDLADRCCCCRKQLRVGSDGDGFCLAADFECHILRNARICTDLDTSLLVPSKTGGFDQQPVGTRRQKRERVLTGLVGDSFGPGSCLVGRCRDFNTWNGDAAWIDDTS